MKNFSIEDAEKVNASLPRQFFNKWVIVGFFLAISLVNVLAFARYDWLFGGQDLQFHLQRINELYQNVMRFNLFPVLGTFSFNQTGSAVMAMYPKLPLYGYVLMRMIFRQPILSYYMGNAMMTFAGLVVSYYSFLSIKKNAKVTAMLFSLVYTLSALNVSYQYLMADIGIVATIVFLPMVFAGLYHWIMNGRYGMLTCGVTVVALSHVLSFILLIFTLIVFTLINWTKLDDEKCLSLAKAIGLTTLLTSTFWLPALVFSTHFKISVPQVFQLNGINLVEYTGAALSNNVSYGFTLVALLGFISGTIGYRILDSGVKQIYWVSLGYWLISSRLFPWHLLQNTPLKMIQFPWRLMIFPQLGFSLIFCLAFVYFLSHVSSQRLIRLGLLGMGMIALVFSIDAQRKIISFEIGAPEITSSNLMGSIPYRDGRAWYKVTNRYEYDNVMEHIANYDYYPNASTSKFDEIANHHVVFDKTNRVDAKTIMGIPDGSEISFTLPSAANKVVLPMVLYGKNYHVSLDSRRVQARLDAHNQLVIHGLTKGSHVVRVAYKGLLVQLLGIALTLLGMALATRRKIVLVFGKRNGSADEPITASK